MWKDNELSYNKLTISTLTILKQHLNDPNSCDKVNNAIISGRFDKTDFNLTETVIMGEDGGMYLLINNLTL